MNLKRVCVKTAKEKFTYIGRQHDPFEQSIWHNPFHTDIYSKEQAIAMYSIYLKRNTKLLHSLPELSDKNIGCWCDENDSCHGDVLRKYAHKEDDKIRLVFSGSRTFAETNSEWARDTIKRIITAAIATGKRILVIEGGAKGIDNMVNSIARNLEVEYLTIPALWKRADGSIDYSAGYVRNTVMAKLADHVVAIHDGESKGTLHMINICKTNDIPLTIQTLKE